MAKKAKVNYRIGLFGILFWIGLAIIADLLTLIPFVGDVVGPIFWLCMSVYLWSIGCGLLNARRLVTSLISMIGELIPGAQELPLIIAGVVLIIIMVRMEDKTGVQIIKKINSKGGAGGQVQNGVTPPRIQNQPLNQDGVRAPNGGLPPSN